MSHVEDVVVDGTIIVPDPVILWARVNLAFTSCVMIIGTVLCIIRRELFPLRERLPGLISFTNLLLFSFHISFCFEFLYPERYPCLVRIWDRRLRASLMLALYLYRSFTLFFRSYISRARVQAHNRGVARELIAGLDAAVAAAAKAKEDEQFQAQMQRQSTLQRASTLKGANGVLAVGGGAGGAPASPRGGKTNGWATAATGTGTGTNATGNVTTTTIAVLPSTHSTATAAAAATASPRGGVSHAHRASTGTVPAIIRSAEHASHHAHKPGGSATGGGAASSNPNRGSGGALRTIASGGTPGTSGGSHHSSLVHGEGSTSLILLPPTSPLIADAAALDALMPTSAVGRQLGGLDRKQSTEYFTAADAAAAAAGGDTGSGRAGRAGGDTIGPTMEPLTYAGRALSHDTALFVRSTGDGDDEPPRARPPPFNKSQTDITTGGGGGAGHHRPEHHRMTGGSSGGGVGGSLLTGDSRRGSEAGTLHDAETIAATAAAEAALAAAAPIAALVRRMPSNRTFERTTSTTGAGAAVGTTGGGGSVESSPAAKPRTSAFGARALRLAAANNLAAAANAAGGMSVIIPTYNSNAGPATAPPVPSAPGAGSGLPGTRLPEMNSTITALTATNTAGATTAAATAAPAGAPKRTNSTLGRTITHRLSLPTGAAIQLPASIYSGATGGTAATSPQPPPQPHLTIVTAPGAAASTTAAATGAVDDSVRRTGSLLNNRRASRVDDEAAAALATANAAGIASLSPKSSLSLITGSGSAVPTPPAPVSGSQSHAPGAHSHSHAHHHHDRASLQSFGFGGSILTKGRDGRIAWSGAVPGRGSHRVSTPEKAGGANAAAAAASPAASADPTSGGGLASTMTIVALAPGQAGASESVTTDTGTGPHRLVSGNGGGAANPRGSMLSSNGVGASSAGATGSMIGSVTLANARMESTLTLQPDAAATTHGGPHGGPHGNANAGAASTHPPGMTDEMLREQATAIWLYKFRFVLSNTWMMVFLALVCAIAAIPLIIYTVSTDADLWGVSIDSVDCHSPDATTQAGLAICLVVLILAVLFRLRKVRDNYHIKNELYVDSCVICGGFCLAQFYYTANVDSTLVYHIMALLLFMGSSWWPLFWSIPLQYCQPITKQLRVAARRRPAVRPRTTRVVARTFENLLSNQRGFDAFKEFLVKEFSVENLFFYAEVEVFRKLCRVENLNAADRREYATELYDRYVAPGSLNQVNLPFDVFTEVHDWINSLEEIPLTVFNTAQKNIMHLMRTDSFARFLHYVEPNDELFEVPGAALRQQQQAAAAAKASRRTAAHRSLTAPALQLVTTMGVLANNNPVAIVGPGAGADTKSDAKTAGGDADGRGSPHGGDEPGDDMIIHPKPAAGTTGDGETRSYRAQYTADHMNRVAGAVDVDRKEHAVGMDVDGADGAMPGSAIATSVIPKGGNAKVSPNRVNRVVSAPQPAQPPTLPSGLAVYSPQTLNRQLASSSVGQNDVISPTAAGGGNASSPATVRDGAGAPVIVITTAAGGNRNSGSVVTVNDAGAAGAGTASGAGAAAAAMDDTNGGLESVHLTAHQVVQQHLKLVRAHSAERRAAAAHVHHTSNPVTGKVEPCIDDGDDDPDAAASPRTQPAAATATAPPAVPDGVSAVVTTASTSTTPVSTTAQAAVVKPTRAGAPARIQIDPPLTHPNSLPSGHSTLSQVSQASQNSQPTPPQAQPLPLSAAAASGGVVGLFGGVPLQPQQPPRSPTASSTLSPPPVPPLLPPTLASSGSSSSLRLPPLPFRRDSRDIGFSGGAVPDWAQHHHRSAGSIDATSGGMSGQSPLIDLGYSSPSQHQLLGVPTAATGTRPGSAAFAPTDAAGSNSGGGGGRAALNVPPALPTIPGSAASPAATQHFSGASPMSTHVGGASPPSQRQLDGHTIVGSGSP